MVIEEHLAEVSPMGKIELEEHLAPKRNVPPKIVPSGEASVDRIGKFLLTIGKTKMCQQMAYVIVPTRRVAWASGARNHIPYSVQSSS